MYSAALTMRLSAWLSVSGDASGRKSVSISTLVRCLVGISIHWLLLFSFLHHAAVECLGSGRWRRFGYLLYRDPIVRRTIAIRLPRRQSMASAARATRGDAFELPRRPHPFISLK